MVRNLNTFQRNTKIFEMWIYRRILKISWREHTTNKSIREKLKRTVPLSTTLAYLGHILRGSSRDLIINITEGFIEGKACRGRRRRTWFSDVAKWLECSKYGKVKRMAEKQKVVQHDCQPSE